MTDLRDLMRQSVEHDHADLVRLVVHSRARGKAIRRRSRLAVACSSFAVLAILGVGAVAATGSFPGAAGTGTLAAGQGLGQPAMTLASADLLRTTVTRVAPGVSVTEVKTVRGRHVVVLAARGDKPASLRVFSGPGISVPHGAAPTCTTQGSLSFCHSLRLSDGSFLRSSSDVVVDSTTHELRSQIVATRVFENHWISLYVLDAASADRFPIGVPLSEEQVVAVLSQPEWAQVVVTD